MQTSVANSQTPAPALAPAARGAPTATEMYDAARLMQRELRNQLNALDGERGDLRRQLRTATDAVDIKGLQGRLAALDARQADVEKQLAAADARVATAASVPGVVIEQPSNGPDIPPEAVVLGGLGMAMVLLIPVSIGYARRLWRRGSQPAPAQIPAELFDRMASIERGVEAVAIEVERIGEGQRFVSQLLAERGRQRELLSDRVEPAPGAR